MYPYIRFFYHVFRARSAPPLDLFGTHVSHHRIWPTDIDPWAELNNGRTLTLYDLGRMPLFQRTGLIAIMKKNGWRGTVAGCSVRYRRRVQLFQTVEMRSRIVGWDRRFAYVAQSMWRGGDCASQVLIRTAVIDGNGMVPTARVAEEAGADSPPLPGWVAAWIEAENGRSWPPED